MSRKYPRIKDAYPDMWTGNGIFTDLNALAVPWKTEKTPMQLDLLYANHSGEKIQSRIIRNNVNTSGVLESGERAYIAQAVFGMYSESWVKLWNTLNFDYSPIENYRMTESEATTREAENAYTDTGTVQNSGTSNERRTGTDTNAITSTVTTTSSGTEERDIYGFDSSQASDSDSVTKTDSETVTTSRTDTETLDLTNALTDNATETRNLAHNATDSGTEERELTRYGNIGVTTTQQMITQEREVSTWLYFEQVFKDIDNVIALQTY